MARPNLLAPATHRYLDSVGGNLTTAWTDIFSPGGSPSSRYTVASGHVVFVRSINVSNVQSTVGSTPTVTMRITYGDGHEVIYPNELGVSLSQKKRNLLDGMPMTVRDDMTVSIKASANSVLDWWVPSFEDIDAS